MTLTKGELADLLFEKVGFNKREAKDMVEIFFEEVRHELVAGKGVKLSGFGNFQLRIKPQRPGRNPKTGEEIPITARRVVTFHASQKLKAMGEQGCKGRPPLRPPAENTGNALLHHGWGERTGGRKAACVALGGAEIPPLKPRKARGKPPLLSASRSVADPAH